MEQAAIRRGIQAVDDRLQAILAEDWPEQIRALAGAGRERLQLGQASLDRNRDNEAQFHLTWAIASLGLARMGIEEVRDYREMVEDFVKMKGE